MYGDNCFYHVNYRYLYNLNLNFGTLPINFPRYFLGTPGLKSPKTVSIPANPGRMATLGLDINTHLIYNVLKI